MAIGIKNIAEQLIGSNPLLGGVVPIGNGQYVPIDSSLGRAEMERRIAKFEQQRDAGIIDEAVKTNPIVTGKRGS